MTTKRFTTTEIVNYSRSNSTKVVSFDTLLEAISHVEKENELHPRSKKFNCYICDTNQKKSAFSFERESSYWLKRCIEINELPQSWK